MKAQILIVDDEENLRFTLKRFLLTEGYEVATAEDYDEALSRMDQSDFDLIFADIILKGKTGMDILREVRKRNLQCPVVIFTGVPTIETATEAVRMGAFDYLPKPVRQDMLLRVTRTALQFKAVFEEKERYRVNLEAIFKSVKDGIITVDKELSVVEINEAAEKICRTSRNEAIGKAFDSLTKGCCGKCMAILEEAIKKKQSFDIDRFECHCAHRPGQVVNLTAQPLLTGPGIFSGGILVIRDKTRLFELERSLRERHQFHGIVGKSPKMQEIYALIEDLADVQATVLISGASGTGKELVGAALHFGGSRRHQPLVKVNCSALSENLLESELFGHVKGAFTGAVSDRVGRFQKADGGTIFLDEIGEMSSRMQLRLLRVLQEMEFERVGDSTTIKVDVRVVAATNKNLFEQVRLGQFREDLYYRLKVMELTLPPLRKRREDIPLLVDYFLKKFNEKFNKKITGISVDVQKNFMEHSWPGNIRELGHTLEHAFILCHQDTIILEHLPSELRAVGLRWDKDDYYQAMLQALEKTRWNKTEAARLLGISRQTLYRKMREYNIVGNGKS